MCVFSLWNQLQVRKENCEYNNFPMDWDCTAITIHVHNAILEASTAEEMQN